MTDYLIIRHHNLLSLQNDMTAYSIQGYTFLTMFQYIDLKEVSKETANKFVVVMSRLTVTEQTLFRDENT